MDRNNHDLAHGAWVLAMGKWHDNKGYIAIIEKLLDEKDESLRSQLAEKEKELAEAKANAEMEFQRAEGKKEMKRWFQEELIRLKEIVEAKDKRLGELWEQKDQLKAYVSHTYHCDTSNRKDDSCDCGLNTLLSRHRKEAEDKGAGGKSNV